ncbi:MAG: response regulator [Bacteroidota bacterium]
MQKFYQNRVILIEDDFQDAEFTKEAIQRMNVSINLEHLSSLEEVRNYDFLKPDVDLILLDMKMPKVTGIEIITMLKAQHQSKDIPIVVFTSAGLPEDIKKVKEMGIYDFLVKPINIEKYFDIVQSACRKWLALSN